MFHFFFNFKVVSLLTFFPFLSAVFFLCLPPISNVYIFLPTMLCLCLRNFCIRFCYLFLEMEFIHFQSVSLSSFFRLLLYMVVIICSASIVACFIREINWSWSFIIYYCFPRLFLLPPT